MALSATILGFPGLTLIAVVEALLAIKLFPSYYGTGTHITACVIALSVNYLFGIVFWVFLYPNFLNPLRHLPGPTVSVLPPFSRYQTQANNETNSLSSAQFIARLWSRMALPVIFSYNL